MSEIVSCRNVLAQVFTSIAMPHAVKPTFCCSKYWIMAGQFKLAVQITHLRPERYPSPSLPTAYSNNI